MLTAATRVAAVIGCPVRHSLSPVIHNAAFAAAGLDWAYVAFEVPPGLTREALVGMRALGLAGCSVTMPHKADVADAVDELTPAAAALHAVNCVVPRGDGRLVGHNTDGVGFVDSLVADAGFVPEGRRCAVLGAGGAARAVVQALATAGAGEVVVVNRTASSAVVAAGLAGDRGRVGSSGDLPGADLVVNATSVGMGSTELPCDPDLLRPGQVVVDLVYEPVDTAWLQAARARGARAIDGVGMLVHQAAHAFTLWTGLEAPVAVMREAARRELAARQARRR